MPWSFPRFHGRAILVGLAVGVAAGVVLASRAPTADPGASREQDGQVVPPLAPAVAERIVRRIDAETTRFAPLSTCPADAWRRRGDLTRSGPVKAAACAKTPDDCLASCLDFASGNACFTLARIMQKTTVVDPLVAERLYLAACEAGDAAGCTNRGAGIRNGGYASDPFHARPVSERQACQFRSFTVACEADDAWGCTMRGQAYEDGEGVAVDAAAAHRDYARACAKDPAFAACIHAKPTRAELQGAPAATSRGGPR